MAETHQKYGKDGIYKSPRPSISLPLHSHFSIIPFLFRNLPTFAHLPALIDAETAQTLTYSHFKTHVLSLSKALLNLNISKNDVVLLFSPNSILYPVCFFAVVATGGVATTANPHYTEMELAKQIKDSNPKLIITVPQLYEKIKHFNLPCIMLMKDAGTSCWSGSSQSRLYNHLELIESCSGMLVNTSLPSVAQNDAADIMYTSGTTGTSKGAVLTHKNFIASALMMSSDQEAYSDSKNVFLCFLPIFHIYALSTLVFAQLQRGDTIVVMARYEINKMLAAVEKYKVTHLYLVPPVGVELVKKEELVKKYDVSSIRVILSAAAPLGKGIMKGLSMAFPQAVICQAYGMTETGGVIASDNICTGSSHFDSTGMLVPLVEVRITNPATLEPLPPFQKGEIWVRGPMVFKGYLNNERATKETLDDKGWLHTGDLGYFDDEGRLYIVERLKEVIKYKGFQVVPLELEEILLTHPEVVDAAVMGIPDAVAGELPIAYVVPARLSSVSAEQLKEFIAKQVAPFKRLRGLIFTDSIPKSPSGKILKTALRQQYLSKL